MATSSEEILGMMNEEIELHDSIVESIYLDGPKLVAIIDAYIHRSDGKPGVASGTGWHQTIRLEMGEAKVAGNLPGPDADIWKGELSLGDKKLTNMIPVSGCYEGPIKLRLEFCEFDPIFIEANRLDIQRVGVAEYLEDFR